MKGHKQRRKKSTPLLTEVNQENICPSLKGAGDASHVQGLGFDYQFHKNKTTQ